MALKKRRRPAPGVSGCEPRIDAPSKPVGSLNSRPVAGLQDIEAVGWLSANAESPRPRRPRRKPLRLRGSHERPTRCPSRAIRSSLSIEFLCDGQQCVVHGVHPDTRVAYSWHGGSLDEIKREELPYIHAEEAQELVNASVALLTEEFGYRVRAPTNKKANDADDDAGPANWSAGPDDLMDHDRLAALAMRFARSGMAAGAVFNFLRTALSNLPGIDEERRQRRLRELRGIVDSAVGKI